jgi:hypothetical protein
MAHVTSSLVSDLLHKHVGPFVTLVDQAERAIAEHNTPEGQTPPGVSFGDLAHGLNEFSTK